MSKYDQLLLYRTSHLPQDVFEKIKEFSEKGGIILTEPDSPWAKLLPKAIKHAIPTDKITKSSYYNVKNKKDILQILFMPNNKKLQKIYELFEKKESLLLIQTQLSYTLELFKKTTVNMFS